MLNLKVFKMKDGVEKSWDDVNFETEIEVVATIEGETNEECEVKAVDSGFGDNDIYGWTYNEII
ncbi:hypothetical protein KPL26_02995 [Clostridium algidicarnis]|uniref:hypothetical protein n=1 Tax=Clostridium algidicarnis TaxID=37659 RepID=UPI001C0E1289|nr:hypothetical protein [Clostridium algidicarnis]MBU3195631.1 hypothetical protein [Clostridium algidicarnis]